MTPIGEKIQIQVFSPTPEPSAKNSGVSQANIAVLCLARLLGRQMAREHFRTTCTKGTEAKRREPSGA